MRENLRINVKLNLNDLKKFSFSFSFNGILEKDSFPFISWSLLIGFVVLYVLISFALQISFLIIPVMGIMLLLFKLSFTLFEAIVTYLELKANYTKSNLQDSLVTYEFFETSLKITSHNGEIYSNWDDIDKVLELKPCFLITLSPTQKYLIPRRCFNSEIQLKEFTDLLELKISKEKLKLKKYKLEQEQQDLEVSTFNKENLELQDVQPLKSLVDVEFYPNEKEMLAINFRLYYRSPVGVTSTLVGIILTYISIVNFMSGNYHLIAIFILGIFSIIGMPVIVYRGTKKTLQKDAILNQTYRFKFYPDFVTINFHQGEIRMRWDEFKKIKEVSAGFLFFITTQRAYFLPKRVLDGKQEELAIIREIVKNKSVNVEE